MLLKKYMGVFFMQVAKIVFLLYSNPSVKRLIEANMTD